MKRIVVWFALVLSLAFAGQVGAQTCTHFIGQSSAGSANGSSDANRMTFANWLKVGGFGSQNRVACLRGDTYTGGTITVPNTIIGTSSFPVYIRATDPNDRPKFDGNGARPVNLEGRWIILSDFWAFDGDNAVVKIHSNCQFCQVKRGVAWNADPTDGNAVFDMQGSNNLMEDVMGFGRGRKIFSVATSANNNTLRRAYGYWQGGTSVSGPTAAFQIGYGQNSVRVENAICRRNYAGVGGTSDPEGCFSGFRTDNTRLEGILVYNVSGDSFHGVAQVELTQDAGTGAPINSNDNTVVNGIAAIVPASMASVKPLEFDDNPSYPAGTNNVVSNAYGIGGTTSTLATRSWSGSINSSAGVPVGFWNLAGNRFCKRVEAGVVTATNLWPWPMNAEIIAAMTFAGVTPVDVNAEIQTAFGTIPADCGGVAPSTYYVAKTGHDTNNTCEEAKDSATPKLTIAAGLGCMSAGSTLIIGDGIYAEYITSAQLISGSSNLARTIIRAANPLGVTMRPAANCTPTAGTNNVVWGSGKKWITLDGIVFDGINCTGGSGVLFFNTAGTTASTDITIQNSEVTNANSSNCVTIQGGSPAPSGFIIRGNKIHRCGAVGTNQHHAVYPWGSNHLIEHNEIYDSTGHGVHQFKTNSNENHNNIIRYNYIYDNLSRCAIIGSGNNNKFHFNICRNNGAGTGQGGVQVSNGSPQNSEVYHNTIYDNAGFAIRVTGAANTKVKNNFLLSNGTNQVSIDASATGTDSATNKVSTDETLLANVSTGRFSPVGNSMFTDCTSNVGFPFNGGNPVCGALDPPRPIEPEVGNVAADQLFMTWANNSRPPLANVQNICTVNLSAVDATEIFVGANNTTKHSLLTPIANGQSPTITCPAGAVQDSANIGGRNAESLSFGPMAVNNNVDAPPATYEFIQAPFRFYEIFNDLSGNPVPLAAANMNIEVRPKASYRVRIKFKAKVATPPAINVRLRYKKNNGTATELTSGFVDGIRAFGNDVADARIPVQGAPTSEILASEETTNVACAFVREAVAIPNLVMSQNSETECEFSVRHDDTNSSGDTFQFLLYTDQGAQVHNSATPIVMPQVTIRGYRAGT